MLNFKTGDLGRDYGQLLQAVLREGEETRPRGLVTREIRPLVLTLTDPVRCVVGRPGFSHALMWMEIAQLLAGEYDKGLLAVCSKNAAELTNSYGAYGPRTWVQLLDVERELKRDSDSRRAAVYVGRPADLRLSADLDMPCTMAWLFHVRDGTLEMQVYMRSWDLVWGLSYDIPMFVAVQQTVANALGVWLGTYTHIAGSGHVYERHFNLDVGVTHEQLCVPFFDSVAATQDAFRFLLKLTRNRDVDTIVDSVTWGEVVRHWLP